MGNLLFLGSRPLISLLDIIVSLVGHPSPKGVEGIGNRAIFTSALVPKHVFHCPLDEVYTGFCLAAAFVIV